MQNVMTAEELTEKFQLLSQRQKEMIFELIDFLSSKSRVADVAEDKKTLLQTSVWSQDDVEPIYEAQQAVSSWRIPD